MEPPISNLRGPTIKSANEFRPSRGARVPLNSVHLNGCLDACSKADAWEEALALFASLEVQATNWHDGYGYVWIRIEDPVKDNNFDELFLHHRRAPNSRRRMSAL